MVVFIDTSALLILLDTDNELHTDISREWHKLRAARTRIVTTNYVLVEAAALCQRRFGMESVRALLDELTHPFEVEWVLPSMHAAAKATFLAANRRRLSLVDCTSFEVMRRLRITRAFAVDPHFAEQGFEVVPQLG